MRRLVVPQLSGRCPFTFLDHALRSGDSLLGADEQQLYNGSLDAKAGVVSQGSLIRSAMTYALPTVIQKRKQIATLTDADISTIETKERLLKEADAALEIVKLGADLIIAIALSEPKRRANLESVLGIAYAVLAKAYDEALHHGETSNGWSTNLADFSKLRAEVDTLLNGRKPFHWPLEFPEVFVGKGDDTGFAAIMSNPPFQGGQKITGAIGTDYRDYLVEYLANGKRGSADLCAYFFLRATHLVRKEGMSALLATNTIAQGSTREVGLDHIVASGWTIPRAIPSRKWHGQASLEVAHIWLKSGEWHGSCVLNDIVVETITAFLTPPGKAQGKPYELILNENRSFQGSTVLGIGFILKPEEAHNLIAKNPCNKDVLYPYLNGEDLNSRPDQSPSRWIINFKDWTLEVAKRYSDCFSIVEQKVKPERDKNNRQVYRDKWWQYAEKRPALYATIADMEQVLVRARIANLHSMTYVPNNWVYNEKVIIFVDCSFTVLQSNIHEIWARNYSSTLRTDMQYTPSDCFETFPFPKNTDTLNDIGERYYAHRQSIMQARQEGLTKTYNRFHNPEEHAPDIVALRALHKEMDEAVARAYGWDDLELAHGFHETKQGLRYTINETARREVLDRLLLLNHQRHEEEVRAGLFEKGAKGKGKKGAGRAASKNTDNGHNSSPRSAPSDAMQIVEADPLEGDVQQGTLF